MNSERVRMMKQGKKVYSFGGYEVARGNLFYNNGYQISDNPILHSYGAYYPPKIGKVANSTYFLTVSKENTTFNYELTTLNLTYNGKSGWHLPSAAEYTSIIGGTISGGSYAQYYIVPNRPGSTFNGSAGALFVGTKVNITGQLVPPTSFTDYSRGAGQYNGIIIFPDNETITSTYNFEAINNPTYHYGLWSANTISEAVLIDLLDQGCAFFPMLGSYYAYYDEIDWDGYDVGFPNTQGTHYAFSPYLTSDYRKYSTGEWDDEAQDWVYSHKVGYFAVSTDDKKPGVDYMGPLFKIYDQQNGIELNENHPNYNYHYGVARMVRKIQ